MKRIGYFYTLAILVFSSCIGTDVVDEPLGPAPSRLEISYTSLSLLEGESKPLSAQVFASDGNLLDVSVNWRSQNTSIATVNSAGLLTAVGAGQVWIDAFTQTLADSLLVTVSTDAEALASVNITTSPMALAIGDSLRLEVVLRTASGTILTDRVVEWASSSPEVCSVNDEGLVIPLATGNTQITASAEGINSAPFPIKVEEDSVARQGTFQGLNGYNVEGTARIEGSADQATLVFDSDFRSQSGPGLYVYLSPNAADVNGGVNLGELQAQSGTQTYSIPVGVDPGDFDHVLVYCQPFRVPFGTANLP